MPTITPQSACLHLIIGVLRRHRRVLSPVIEAFISDLASQLGADDLERFLDGTSRPEGFEDDAALIAALSDPRDRFFTGLQAHLASRADGEVSARELIEYTRLVLGLGLTPRERALILRTGPDMDDATLTMLAPQLTDAPMLPASLHST